MSLGEYLVVWSCLVVGAAAVIIAGWALWRLCDQALLPAEEAYDLAMPARVARVSDGDEPGDRPAAAALPALPAPDARFRRGDPGARSRHRASEWIGVDQEAASRRARLAVAQAGAVAERSARDRYAAALAGLTDPGLQRVLAEYAPVKPAS